MTRIVQAIQITHRNIAQIMALPPIVLCRKLEDGSYLFCADFGKSPMLKALTEGMWVLEFEDGTWYAADDRHYKLYYKED